MAPKMVPYLIKIKKLTPTQANILKQEMLAKGGEAAISYGAITHSVEFTDCLVAGTLAELKAALGKLKLQPFGFKELAEELEKALDNFEKTAPVLTLGKKTFNLAEKPLIMAILNLTPDSFYNGGQYNQVEAALKRAEEMLEEGADIIDLGGESSRPGAAPVSAEEEIQRVLPVLEKIYQKFKALISIDTTKAEVARRALDQGAVLVNDISALRSDPQMAGLAAKSGSAVVLMHLQGMPADMQVNPHYEDVVVEISDFFKERIALARSAGIREEKIILDPGIGFGKKLEHNLEILRNLASFKMFGRPILVGVSRKSLIGQILDLPLEERLEGSLGLAALAGASAANLLRVHDVKETRRVLKIVQALK